MIQGLQGILWQSRRSLLVLCLALFVSACGSRVGGAEISQLESGERELFSIQPKYRGESQAEGGSVVYLNEAERARLKAIVRNGRFVDSSGALLDPDLENHPERGGFTTYVVDAKGTLYLSFDHKHGHFHHSSILAGAPVLAAGDMTIIAGELTEISNASGHYRPPPRSIDVLLKILRRLGVPLKEVKIERIGSDTEPSPATPPAASDSPNTPPIQ